MVRSRPYVQAWHIGKDYGDCRASDLLGADWQPYQWRLFFLISRKYRKNEGLIRDFSKAHAPRSLLLTKHCWHHLMIKNWVYQFLTIRREGWEASRGSVNHIYNRSCDISKLYCDINTKKSLFKKTSTNTQIIFWINTIKQIMLQKWQDWLGPHLALTQL